MSTDLEPEFRQLAAAAEVARLATIRPDRTPHVVVLTFALDGDRLVSAVDHKPKTTNDLQRLRNVRENPAVSVLVDHYDEDWSQLWWVRGDGTATVAESGPDHTHAVDLLVEKYPAYRQRPPTGPAIIVTIERWTTWRAS